MGFVIGKPYHCNDRHGWMSLCIIIHVDMDDLLQQSMDARGDYKPFQNKHFAFLFLLMYSPRLMVLHTLNAYLK